MKTALVLSGGGSRGAYEIGVWQALRELGIKIDIVTGTSIGSMNATLVSLGLFEEAKNFWLTLDTDEVFDYKHAIENKGVKFTTVKDVIGDCISEAAVRKSAVDLGIVTVKLPGMEVIRCWKEDIPEGKLLDYVFASCSCFPVVTPYEIDEQKYLDGGYGDNMPIGLALEKNPDKIIAVNLDGFGKVLDEDIERAKDRLMIIESHQKLGNFAVFHPEHAAQIMRLGYLDAMKAFGAYCGSRYTFIKGQFPIRDLRAMEEAADSLNLDPGILYTKDVFYEAVRKEIDIEKKDFHEPLQLGEKVSFLALCLLLKKDPDLKLPKTLTKIIGTKFAAARWTVAEGLV